MDHRAGKVETFSFLLVTTFYPPFHLGGDAVHVQYLAESLAERGHEVHVEFAPAAHRLKTGRANEIRSESGPVRLHPIPSPVGSLQPLASYMLGTSPGVSRFHTALARQIRPDIVHFHNISLLGLGVVDGWSGTRQIYTAHDYWLRCARSDLFKYGQFPCDRPTCFRCLVASGRPPQLWRESGVWARLHGIDAVIAPSRFMKRALEGCLECPVVYVPNFAPDRNPAGAWEEPGDYYLFVGAHEPHKGLQLLLAVAEASSDVAFVFAGRGSLESRIREVQASGRGRVRADGWLSAGGLAPRYQRARALVMPSLSHENAPLSALEALSWGTPLLVSRRGGLEELLSGGEAGRSFDPNPHDLLEAILRFEGEGLAQRLRPTARKSYERSHTPERYVARYMSLVQGDLAGADYVERPPAGAGDLGPARGHDLT